MGRAAPAGCTTCLGSPTNAVPPVRALGAFYRIHTTLTAGRKPEVLFIGTQIDPGSAIERWPLVKALEAFGRFSGVQPSATRFCRNNPTKPDQPQCDKTPWDPTFNLDHARYSSPYLVFVDKDLIGLDLKMHQGLTPREAALFRRHIVPLRYGGATLHDQIWGSAVEDGAGDTAFPLTVVKNYLEAGAQTAVQGDLTPLTSVIPVPFATVQQSLQRGKPVGTASRSLVPDVNEEANIITALICHADRNRPRSVCSRSIVRTILKGVR